jgi:FkbM family methyltransferase
MIIKIFGRTISIKEVPTKAINFIKVLREIRKIKHPAEVLFHYLNQRSPSLIEFKDGTILNFSTFPLDLSTAFVIFTHKEYGIVPANSIILDIGSNIGVFSIYAAKCGAAKIYAFEPNKEAYAVLCKNIKDNKFEEKIIPFNLAVTDHGNSVKIPIKSSTVNKIAPLTDNTNDDGHEIVDSITVEKIIKSNQIKHIDLLKMDCEGAEYDIIPSLTNDICMNIDEIRMECHGNTIDGIVDHLHNFGFEILHNNKRSSDLWNLWLTKKSTRL